MNAPLHAMIPVGRLGRYEVLGRLAVGGMAEIFLARETGPQAASRELVVKRILPHVADDESRVKMFVREARLSMKLRHPNICTVYEFGEQDGAFFLAMEWVHGPSLLSLIKHAREAGGLPMPMVAKLVADIAGALHHAHHLTDASGRAFGLVHRDVTPENIMVSYDGVPKLLDFGIAKLHTQPDKTQGGVLRGKFAYMSPEQYRGDPVDGRSDIFSLGVCLYEALTGYHLYVRESQYETVAAIVLDQEVPSVRDVRPEVPEALDVILQRALAKYPEQRFASAEDLEVALRQFLVDQAVVVRDSEVAGFLRRLFADEIARGPILDRDATSSLATSPGELPVVAQAALGAHLDEVEAALVSRARAKRRFVLLLVVLLVVGVLGLTGWSVLVPPTTEPDGAIQADP